MKIYEDSDVQDYDGPSPVVGCAGAVCIGLIVSLITIGFIWGMLKTFNIV